MNGYALNIQSNDELSISTSKVKTKGELNVALDILSLEKDTIYAGDVDVSENKLNFFVYFNNETMVDYINLKITFKAIYDKGESEYNTYSMTEGIIYPGDDWQLIDGNRGMESSG